MIDRAEKVASLAGIQSGGDFLETVLKLDLWHQGALLWDINKSLSDPLARAFVGDRLASVFSGLATLPAATPTPAALEFKRDGVVPISDIVTPAEAAEMLAYLSGIADRIPEGSILHHRTEDVVRVPHAFRIATDERVLAIASHHLGSPATIMQMDAWWSMPGSQSPEGPQIFHRDRDDFRACKLFLYLTDVSAESGPHIFVKGTHDRETVKKAVREKGLDVSAAGPLFSGTGREISESVADIFGANVTEMIGPPATCFLANTYCFHRGKVPTANARCLLQVSYGMVPYPGRLERWVSTGLSQTPPDSAKTPQAEWATHFTLAANSKLQDA